MLCKIHSRLIARPPLILATIVARLLLLTGKSLFAYGLRARRRPPRTREKYDLMWLAVGVRNVRIVRNVRTGGACGSLALDMRPVRIGTELYG